MPYRTGPGVLERLRQLVPRDEKGRTKHRFFQRLIADVGEPKLREHLIAVITLMKASPSWSKFMRLLQRALPKYSQTLELPLEEDEEVEENI